MINLIQAVMIIMVNEMRETVIQFGEGNFLRGFFDYFLDVMNKDGLYDGKAVVIQPREGGKVMCLPNRLQSAGRRNSKRRMLQVSLALQRFWRMIMSTFAPAEV